MARTESAGSISVSLGNRRGRTSSPVRQPGPSAGSGGGRVRPLAASLSAVLVALHDLLARSIVLRYNVLVKRPVSRNDRIGQQLDYWTLAELRYHIRGFLRVREEAARAAGIGAQQYLLLLQVKGMQGRQPPTIGALAERLQLRHHSTVELIDRLVDRGMLVRRPGGRDRREVLVELRPSGEAILKRLALDSLRELETEGPALVSTLRRLIGGSKGARRRSRRSEPALVRRSP